MLTLFTIPKPFLGHSAVIQWNAIRSWCRLDPAGEVVLFGDDPGTREMANECGARHVPDINRSEYGTPLLHQAFAQVDRLARHDLICYVNADVMLLSDLLRAVGSIPFDRFLLAGRRWDVDLRERWDFESAGWEARLRQYVAAHATLHPPSGSDYFVFRRGTFRRLPPFAVGRPGWDNWMIYDARASGIPVIDGTRAVTAIHQNHDYRHVPGGTEGGWEGPEAERNRRLIDGWMHRFTLEDADWTLTEQGVRRMAWTPSNFRRRLRAAAVLHPNVRSLLQSVERIRQRRSGPRA